MLLDQVIPGTDALRSLGAAHDAAWRATDPDLLGLCRDRVAMLLDHRPTVEALDPERRAVLASTDRAGLGDREVAALEFTEQYVVDVASLTDDQVGALRAHLGDEGLVDFVNALLVVEQRMSLEAIFDGVL